MTLNLSIILLIAYFTSAHFNSLWLINQKNNASIARFLNDNRWTIFALLLVFALYQLGPIITPFLAAAILAYICDPLVDKTQHSRHSKS